MESALPDKHVTASQMHAIHNTWRNFEEPDSFLPERWLEPGAEYARSLKGGELACTSGKQGKIVQYCMQ